jgi:hypothetical protein
MHIAGRSAASLANAKGETGKMAPKNVEVCMENETLVPVEKYAAMHRMSIYKVIQMANRGALQAKIVEKEGKKVTYIVTSEDAATEVPKKAEAAAEAEEAIDYKEAYETLQKELQALKERMDKRDREQ